mmetsp:Transcript_20135/g.41152  ORF Transcript_20135/g.41152 Transcript_20135/m.41152 type:complete len:503 (+) Transcript_20135:88-1596(+)
MSAQQLEPQGGRDRENQHANNRKECYNNHVEITETEDSNTKSNCKKGKKRKHSSLNKKPSKEELYRIESRERYDKLHHISSKHLHREAKVVKSFECQKIVRAIKAAKEASEALKAAQSSTKDDGTGKASDPGDTMAQEKRAKRVREKLDKSVKKVMRLEQKLEKTKKFDLEVLVQAGLKRLGMLNLDPRQDELDEGGEIKANEPNEGSSKPGDESKNKNAKEEKSQSIQPQSEDPFYQSLLEILLQHKRLSSAMDQLNEKVTEYRRWTMRRQDMLRVDGIPEFMRDDSMIGGKKKKNIKKSQCQQVNKTLITAGAGGFHGVTRKRGLDGHEGTSGLFIGSLSGMPMEGYFDDAYSDNRGEDEMEIGQYGYNYPMERKKNRPGQRARKAKALAIEARKVGKTWESSLNWREKKKEKNGSATNENDSHAISNRRRGSQSGQNGGGRNSDHPVLSEKNATKHDAQKIATMGKTWKENGQHPSWAAKAAQKSMGIVEFKGTKITFD